MARCPAHTAARIASSELGQAARAIRIGCYFACGEPLDETSWFVRRARTGYSDIARGARQVFRPALFGTRGSPARDGALSLCSARSILGMGGRCCRPAHRSASRIPLHLERRLEPAGVRSHLAPSLRHPELNWIEIARCHVSSSLGIAKRVQPAPNAAA